MCVCCQPSAMKRNFGSASGQSPRQQELRTLGCMNRCAQSLSLHETAALATESAITLTMAVPAPASPWASVSLTTHGQHRAALHERGASRRAPCRRAVLTGCRVYHPSRAPVVVPGLKPPWPTCIELSLPLSGPCLRPSLTEINSRQGQAFRACSCFLGLHCRPPAHSYIACPPACCSHHDKALLPFNTLTFHSVFGRAIL